MTADERSRTDLLAEIDALKLRLEDTEETLRAIQDDEVDAFVVNTAQGERVFTLQGAEHPYRVLVESMNEGAATLTLDGRVLYCNQRLARMLAIPLEKLIGSPLGVCVAPADALTFARLLEKSRHGRCKEALELITGEGVLLPVLFSCGEVDLDVNPLLSVVVTDLSEQKRSEKLMEAEKLARSIIEQAGEAIIVCDARGHITRINEQAQRLSRKTSSALAAFDAVLPLRVVAVASEGTLGSPAEAFFSIAAPLRGATYRNVEVVLELANDHLVHLLLNAATLFNDQDEIFGCVVTLTDISERKQIEEALASSEKRLRLFFQYAPVALAMLDREMRYLYVSQHWISSYGLGDRNLQGLYHYDVFPQIGDDWKNVHRRGLAGEVLRSEGDCFVTNDGSLRWLRWEIRPWYTVQGSIGGIVIFSEDITASKAAVVALQESEARTRARSEELDKVLNAVPAAVWIAHDEQSRQITGNSLSYQWLRIPQGANPSKSAPEDERPQTFRIFRNGAEVAPAELPVQVAATGVEVRDYEYDIVYPDGEVRHMFGNATPLWDEQGKPRGSVSAFVDITARKHAELALREQEESFRLIAENLNGFIATLDAEGRRLYNSPAYARLLGDRSLVGTWSFDEVHADDRERVIAAFREAVATGSGQHLEYRFVMADGSICVLESRSGVVRNDEGRTKRVVVVSHDITERRRAEEAIHHLAFHDGLTQLPNRLALYDRLRQSMAAGKRSGCYGALMFLDLDNFKSLNDTHGHEVGDLLLIEAAARLRNCVRAIDTVARFGGDEFVVILGDLCADQAESTLQAARVAEKIRLCVAEPYSLNVRREGEAAMLIEHRCTVSIGIVLFLGQEASQDDLLKWADAAMYRAKTCEQNLIRFHASSD